MKFKIKPYLLRLIKVNLVYIASILLLLTLIAAVVKISLDKIKQLDQNIKKEKEEVRLLEKKVSLFKSTIPSTAILDENITLLNNLIPNVEDYFTIVYSLEKLSEKTNFTVVGYNVDINESTPNKLRLSVTGIGDSTAFINFLKQYNFGGGRLITSDKISLDPEEFADQVKINLTFYNKTLGKSNENFLPSDGKMFEDIDSIKSKIDFVFSEAKPLDDVDLNYPKKTNPF